MSYDVTDDEKHRAQRSIIYFNHASRLLNKSSDYLNVMKNPFKDNPEISTDEIIKTRAALRKFRDTSVKKFNEFKITSFKCVRAMQYFSSDTQVLKLMKSFISSIDDLQLKVNDFVDLFSNLQDAEFSKNVVTAIETIQKQCEIIDSIIDERVKPHIQTNILASNWIDEVGDELEVKLEKKSPIILDLFNQRQQQLNEVLKGKQNI